MIEAQEFEVVDWFPANAGPDETDMAKDLRRSGLSGDGLVYGLIPPYERESDHELVFYRIESVDGAHSHEYDSYFFNPSNLIGLYFEPENEPTWISKRQKIRFVKTRDRSVPVCPVDEGR